jgi:polyvinyl alcohol dehydrogenase (cytochrome)
MRTLLTLSLVVVAAGAADAQTASRVIRQIDQRCAGCHQTGDAGGRVPEVEGAPTFATLRQMPAETILRAITTGPMRIHAEGVPDDVKRAMAEFVSGRKLSPIEAGEAARMPNRCAANARMDALTDAASWNGWSPDPTNARYQSKGGVTAAEIPRLTLKWAFGFPGASSVYGQPTVAGGRVFVGVDTGYVYALDARSGCVHWSFLAETGVRNAVAIGPGSGAARHVAYFGDIRANVYAVNAETGALIWKVQADPHPLAAVTGSPTLHEVRLYVPLSSREEAAGGSLNYPCCTFRGSIAALDAATGKQIWKTHAIPGAPVRSRRNAAGTQLWTGAGAAIWHAPTIDVRRGAVYIATGDAYTEPAHRNTDAVMALDLKTGRILWSVQDHENDAWLVACGQDRTENCPKDLGPDFDFGASPILQTLAGGRRVLLAGNKSGQVFAHDPDRQGALLWKATLVEKIGESEILFGGAADGRAAYFALDNGSVAALDPATGERRWFLPPRPAGPPAPSGVERRRGVTASLTAVPGAVLAGGQDGVVRAHAADTGAVIWSVDTRRDFETVNRVPAKGGSLGAPGPTVAGGMLFVGSGYVGLGNGAPGNVLLAFGLP